MKLTNDIRDRMVIKIMSDKFGKQREALTKTDIALADDVYNSIEGINKIKKLPIDWFINTICFTCYFHGERETLTMSERRPIPYAAYNEKFKFALENKFTQRRIKMKQDRYELGIAEKELREELKKVLYSVTTDKRLVEIWPEATKWLPSPTAVYLPANVDVNKLRSLMKPL